MRSEFSKSIRNPLIYVFIFALIFHFYYVSFNSTSIKPDATLYLAYARTLVLNGTFVSNVINNSISVFDPYYVTNGFIEHRFFPYIYPFSS
jgi:hypothetical protein